MKVTTTIFSLGLLFTMSAYGQKLEDTAKEINAQTTITRASIDAIVAKLGSASGDPQFSTRDYLEQSSKFKANIEHALNAFESKLEKQILTKAAALMDQYNALYRSTSFSQQQKELLLRERQMNMTKEFQVLSVQYQGIIKEVYALVPNYDLTFTYDLSGYSESWSISEDKVIFEQADKRTFEMKSNKGLQWKDSITLGFFSSDCRNTYVKSAKMEKYVYVKGDRYSYQGGDCQLNHDETFVQALMHATGAAKDLMHKVAYKGIKGACKSSICLGLRSIDLSTLVSLVKNQLDRTITLKMADGFQASLSGTGLNVSGIKGVLSCVDYPESLPFEVK